MPYSTVVHHFTSPNTPQSCAYELGQPDSKNAIVFVGGLGDGPHTIPYVKTVAEYLESSRPELGYSVFEIRMTSSFGGFGFSSLQKDVGDMSALVRYLRIELGREKIVLLGHSTGCQDCIEYARLDAKSPADERPWPVEGFILQGPVSDREAIAMSMSQPDIEASLSQADTLIQKGREDEIMPRWMIPVMETPVTAYRWRSLAGRGGDDDCFSSDLSDEKLSDIWGALRKPVLILHSADDEHVPSSVDVKACTQKWMSFCTQGIASPLSGSIPGASHRVDADEAQKWLARTVAAFLASLQDT